MSGVNPFDEEEFYMVESDDLIVNLARPTVPKPTERLTPEPVSSDDNENLIAAFLDMNDDDDEEEDGSAPVESYEVYGDDLAPKDELDQDDPDENEDDPAGNEPVKPVAPLKKCDGKQLNTHVILLLVVGLLRLALEIGAVQNMDARPLPRGSSPLAASISTSTPRSSSPATSAPSVTHNLSWFHNKPVSSWSPTHLCLGSHCLIPSSRAEPKPISSPASPIVPSVPKAVDQPRGAGQRRVIFPVSPQPLPPTIPPTIYLPGSTRTKLPPPTLLPALSSPACVPQRIPQGQPMAPPDHSMALSSAVALVGMVSRLATPRVNTHAAPVHTIPLHADVKHAMNRAASRAATVDLLTKLLKRTSAEAHALKMEAERLDRIRQARLARATALVLATDAITLETPPRHSCTHRTHRTSSQGLARSPTRGHQNPSPMAHRNLSLPISTRSRPYLYSTGFSPRAPRSRPGNGARYFSTNISATSVVPAPACKRSQPSPPSNLSVAIFSSRTSTSPAKLPLPPVNVTEWLKLRTLSQVLRPAAMALTVVTEPKNITRETKAIVYGAHAVPPLRFTFNWSVPLLAPPTVPPPSLRALLWRLLSRCNHPITTVWSVALPFDNLSIVNGAPSAVMWPPSTSLPRFTLASAAVVNPIASPLLNLDWESGAPLLVSDRHFSSHVSNISSLVVTGDLVITSSLTVTSPLTVLSGRLTIKSQLRLIPAPTVAKGQWTSLKDLPAPAARLALPPPCRGIRNGSLKYLPAPDERLALPSPCDCLLKKQAQAQAQREQAERKQAQARSQTLAQARARARAQAQVEILEEALFERTSVADAMHAEVRHLRKQLAKAHERETRMREMHTKAVDAVEETEAVKAAMAAELQKLSDLQARMQSQLNATEKRESEARADLMVARSVEEVARLAAQEEASARAKAEARARLAVRREKRLAYELREAKARASSLKKREAKRYAKHRDVRKKERGEQPGKHGAKLPDKAKDRPPHPKHRGGGAHRLHSKQRNEQKGAHE